MLQTKVVKSDGKPELHLVYGEVYAPNRPDAQGEYMTAETIRAMAHRFVRERKFDQIDVMHNNKVVKCDIVESWLEQDGGTFVRDAWCIGVHVPVPELWEAFKTGELNGFSMEAAVHKVEREVEIEIPDVIRGATSNDEGHIHKFEVSYAVIDGQLQFQGGKTDVVDGHSHEIAAGTHTQKSQGHSHRFSSVDLITFVDPN
jgi:hypothetical protein